MDMKYSWSTRIVSGLLVTWVIGWAFPLIAQETPVLIPMISPLYPQVLEAIEQLTPGERIQVLLATEKEAYQVGEPFEIRFSASEDSYVILMRIATDGSITFLTPNSQHADFKVQGNMVYSTGSLTPPLSEEQVAYDLGMTLNVGAPTGTEVLNLFCSPEKFSLFDVGTLQETFYTIRPDDEERLQALFDRLSTLSQIEWSGTSAAFLVEPESAAAPEAAPKQRTRSMRSSSQAQSSLIPDAGSQKRLPRKFGALRPMGGTGTTGKSFPPIGATDN